ncbi:phosphopantothenoylcysteine decarboxylase isoform X2 [Neopelma chrysocephalum]|uniref:phosphopantothenoylcysteine decarboxylase isoform X2 n=1 Tax=Neopelma chrysocephalum TaxID=114329 RepID=UPI000FCCE858|nr:phosphopantothenoylcysteine decarboxylase isoform X2 [Neopelma chrysocephalum]
MEPVSPLEPGIPAGKNSPVPQKKFHVLVGVTGSVAALKLPLLVVELLKIPGLEVKVVTTERAKHFYNAQEIPVTLYGDEDEWQNPLLGLVMYVWNMAFEDRDVNEEEERGCPDVLEDFVPPQQTCSRQCSLTTQESAALRGVSGNVKKATAELWSVFSEVGLVKCPLFPAFPVRVW